ncbi:MAG: sensor histidine kinase [Thermoanaerobaculaceae bacterium]
MDGQGTTDLGARFTRREVRSATHHALRLRRGLWIWLAAALVPLALMLVLQYTWLAELQESSSVARRATLQKVLDLLSKEASGPYMKAARRVLDVSGPMLAEPGRPALAQHFRAFGTDLARLHFVLVFGAEKTLLYFDQASGTLQPMPPSRDASAILVAAAPWSLMAARGEKPDKHSLQVDERDRSCRIVLRPVLDAGTRVVGVVGFVVDEERFRSEVLPRTISVVLASVDLALSVNKTRSLAVSVCDATGLPVIQGGPGCSKKGLARRSFSFLFTDWTVVLDDTRETPESWARRNFAFNLAVSAALAGVLLVAVVLALRAASRQVRLSAMKSDFVSNVSHELRTPLASIRVFGELMRLGRVASPEKVREYGEHIENESRRLSQLVENILDFGRIESGRKAYTFAEADLGEVVRGAVASFGVRMQQAGFNLALELPEGPGPRARVDAGAVDHAICNLLDNAVKYSGESREVVVRLRLEGGDAVVEVVDRGIGIPRAEQARIFDRFYRVSTGAVHEVRGVGLGLAIVRHIVAAHGGTVSVDSEPGRGSTFAVRLPLAGPPGQEPAAAQTR